MEDADQNIHLKNLTVHQAGSEEDSLNLLFLGDTNRMIAEVSSHEELFPNCPDFEATFLVSPKSQLILKFCLLEGIDVIL